MVEVNASYINLKNKRGGDYFVYLDVEVKGHATKIGYDNNIKVCAGISAVTYGIARLLNELQFNVEYRKGYYRVWTNYRHDLRNTLDKDSVYAINTMVCQLYEIYKNFPNAFKEFNLNEKENEYERNEEKSEPRKPFRQRRTKMGLSCLTEEVCPEKN